MSHERRLVEEWLPLSEINENARREMGFIRVPKISNIHTWLARRPTSAARALTLASILPSSQTTKARLRELLGFKDIDEQPYQLLYLVDPDRESVQKNVEDLLNKDLGEIVVIDPMAGGGSIPLEALRLGFRTIAIDYNPVAYIILKATLEYPARYGKGLYEKVKEEAKAFLEYAKNELAKYYPSDTRNYIFAKGFVCPKCDGLVPIIHSTRLRKNGPYMQFKFDKKRKTFRVEIVEHETEFEKLRCPYCSRPFTKNEVLGRWVTSHKRLLKHVLEGELKRTSTLKDELLSLHIPLIKQAEQGFTSCNKRDAEAFVNACLDLSSQVKKLRPYVPNAPIPHENKVFEPVKRYGIKHWYEFYNPRQLLVLAKLIEYVHKRTKALTEERAEYGVAIATYLALGVSKISNFNNITTTWHSTRGVIRDLTGHYASGRSVGFGLDYCELVVPLEKRSLGWIYEAHIENPTATHGGIYPVVKGLSSWVDGLGDRIAVYLGDARELSRILGISSVDLVNVDPPYFGQHFYSDLSEFFWQILRSTLNPAIEAGFLFNRDESRGRVECLVSGWSPSLPVVPRGGEIIVRRGNRKLDIAEIPYTKEWWTEQMWNFFTEAYEILKDDGVMIVWYTHSDPKAWEAVLGALYASRFLISKFWTIRTEMAHRRVALSGSAFFTSLSLIARKTGKSVIVGEHKPKELLLNEQVKEVITKSVVDAFGSARASGASDWESYIMGLAGAIAGATIVRNPVLESIELPPSETLNSYIHKVGESEIAKQRYRRAFRFFRDSLYPTALYIGASTVLEQDLRKAGLSDEQMNFIVGTDDITKAYLIFWLSTRYQEKNIEPSVDYDFAEKICKVIGTTISSLESDGLIKKSSKNTYLVPFGKDVLEAFKGRLEIIDRTAATAAMYLLKMIVDSPIKDNQEKCAKQVLSIKPINKQTISTATFLLRTARESELRKASISQLTKAYVERVLKMLYEK